MKVMSFNVQNTYQKISLNKVEHIVKIINEENPDIIGVQELTPFLKKELQKQLKGYIFYGRPRLGGMPIADEYNTLIIKKNIAVIETNTYSLGRKPDKVRSKNLLSAFPRICTVALCVINKKKIKIINTHLDHLLDRSKKYQLSVLYELFKENEYPLLIMGDFNMHPGNDSLKEFTKKLSLTNTSENLGRTCIKSEKDRPIDHILVSNNLKFKNIKKIENDISDHFPIICEIEF